MTKDIAAHATCHHHPGIIRVPSYRIKVLEHVRINYVSNKLQCDYLRNANVKNRKGPSWRGYAEDGISDIL